MPMGLTASDVHSLLVVGSRHRAPGALALRFYGILPPLQRSSSLLREARLIPVASAKGVYLLNHSNAFLLHITDSHLSILDAPLTYPVALTVLFLAAAIGKSHLRSAVPVSTLLGSAIDAELTAAIPLAPVVAACASGCFNVDGDTPSPSSFNASRFPKV